MTAHLLIALENLQKQLLMLATRVEEQLQRSVNAFCDRNVTLAQEVIEGDREIDQLEVDVEEECLKILALYQPLAMDLRFVVTALKMINDLERIGDLAGNLAQRVTDISKTAALKDPFDVRRMAEMSKEMLRQSIDAFIQSDSKLANHVLALDEEVDRMHRSNFEIIRTAIVKDNENSATIISYLSVSRYFERIADLATNIAEDVIYMVEGSIVRHG